MWFMFLFCSIWNQCWLELSRLPRTNCQLQAHMVMIMCQELSSDICLCTWGSTMNIGWPLMKSIRTMTEELLLISSLRLSLCFKDGESRVILKCYLKKLMVMVKELFCLTNLWLGQSRRNWTLTLMTMPYDINVK